MSQKTNPTDPLGIALAAVDARIQAAEHLYRAAVMERDIEAQASQRATLHALLDEKLDVTGGIIDRAMRGTT